MIILLGSSNSARDAWLIDGIGGTPRVIDCSNAKSAKTISYDNK